MCKSATITLLAGERQPGESNKAVQACNDYLRLGPGRTLAELCRKYRETPENAATRSINTMQKWSQGFSWPERETAYDKKLEDEKNRRARQIMESGLALDYERVVELKHLADFLKDQMFVQQPVIAVQGTEGEPVQVEAGTTYPNIWLRDVKMIGKGKDAVTVNIVRFNAAIIDQLRGVLDDLAKETGGRINKHEMTGPNGGPIEVTDEQHNRALSTLAATLGKLLPGTDPGEESGLGTTE